MLMGKNRREKQIKTDILYPVESPHAHCQLTMFYYPVTGFFSLVSLKNVDNNEKPEVHSCFDFLAVPKVKEGIKDQ